MFAVNHLPAATQVQAFPLGLFHSDLGRRLAIVAIASLLVLMAGCSVNPATGTPDLVFKSESKEIELGKELHEKIIETTPIYTHTELQEYVDAIGQKVVKNSHRPELSYTFTVIDAPDINAFALPGGYIYINRGLIGYLNSEAQLAAVLAHEVGHVTARHAIRQDTAKAGAKASTAVVSILSILTTGTSVLGDVTDLWSSAAVMGYGREMELEADGLGAEYLFNSGYNPKAMIEVIALLKDQERFSRLLARESGQKASSYHGLFSSHPRNDTRLQEVVGKANALAKAQAGTDNVDTFRDKTEGLVFGINFQAQSKKSKEKNTYSHARLGFSIDFPLNWSVENQRSNIIANAADQHAQIKLAIDLLKSPKAPNEYIRDQLKIPFLKQSEAIGQFGLIGHMGIAPEGTVINGVPSSHPSRIAVLYQGRRAYVLHGLVSNTVEGIDDDELFVKAIRSFRPSRTARIKAVKSKTIHYVKANQDTNFKRLAQHIKLGKYTEQQLRLLNGYYPKGEPKPGDWLKIVR